MTLNGTFLILIFFFFGFTVAVFPSIHAHQPLRTFPFTCNASRIDRRGLRDIAAAARAIDVVGAMKKRVRRREIGAVVAAVPGSRLQLHGVVHHDTALVSVGASEAKKRATRRGGYPRRGLRPPCTYSPIFGKFWERGQPKEEQNIDPAPGL